MGVGGILSVDPDTVEAHNVPNQLYGVGDIGRPKVEAFREWCIFADGRGTAGSLAERFDGRGVEPLVISAVDSMRSREEIWRAIRPRLDVEWYVDARMGAEVCTVYTVPMRDADAVTHYERSLHSDEDGLDEPCTARGIIYTAFLAAAVVAGQVKRILAKQPVAHCITVDCASWDTVTSGQKVAVS
jgi:hypothetical protein